MQRLRLRRQPTNQPIDLLDVGVAQGRLDIPDIAFSSKLAATVERDGAQFKWQYILRAIDNNSEKRFKPQRGGYF